MSVRINARELESLLEATPASQNISSRASTELASRRSWRSSLHRVASA